MTGAGVDSNILTQTIYVYRMRVFNKKDDRMTETIDPVNRSYSFDWWYQKRKDDMRLLKLSTPRYPKVKPYMKGWLHEFLKVDVQQ